MHGRDIIAMGSAGLLALAIMLDLQGCLPASIRTAFIPKTIVVDSTGPHFLHHSSEIKYWDRISTADRATNFAWMDDTGKVHEMNEYYDKIVVLSFFSPNSIPSLNQLRAIDSARALGDTNVLWIGVGMKVGQNGKGVMLLDSFARMHKINYELLVGSPDFGFTYGGIDVVPTTFVVTLRRKVSATFEGFVNAQNLLSAISDAEKKR
ncbi:MAG TPA: hypothetical protein VGM92_03520 [Candidatus Kapabacteria bacterium]|jgi:hypothetical protein